MFLLVTKIKITNNRDVQFKRNVSAYLVQRPGWAEYLSSKHGETNWYDVEGIEGEIEVFGGTSVIRVLRMRELIVS
jgi:hypothetical protein